MSRVVYNSENRITQKYKAASHKGVDIGYNGKDEEKNNVYANCSGYVYEVVDGLGNNTKYTGVKSWGNYVYIKHPNGMFARYAHLKKGILVKEKQNVDEKTIIGVIGNSGRSYGRHLHFEVSKGYSSSKRIDPTKYLTTPVYNGELLKYTGTFPSLKNGYKAWVKGDKNKNVGYIQAFLNWYLGCKLAVDNSFGPATKEQVIKFQKITKLTQDGKVGPKTIKAMKNAKK